MSYALAGLALSVVMVGVALHYKDYVWIVVFAALAAYALPVVVASLR